MAHLITIKPWVTEKAMRLAKAGQYTFVVNRGARKLAVAREVAQTYAVHVTSVGITKRPAKVKSRGTQAARIKAVVTVKKGETIKGYDLPTTDAATASEKKEIVAATKTE